MKKSEFIQEYVDIPEWEKSFQCLRNVDMSLGSYQMDYVYEYDEVEEKILEDIIDCIHARYTFGEIFDKVIDYNDYFNGADWYEWYEELFSISIADDYERYCNAIIDYMDYWGKWDPEDEEDDDLLIVTDSQVLLV